MRRKSFSAKGFTVEAALVGMVALGVAVGSAGFASADPEEPLPPPPPSPGAGLFQGAVDPNAIVDARPPASPGVTALGPLGAVAGSGGLQGLILGQNPVPSIDGSGAAPPSPDVLQSGSFLLPRNYRVPSPDQDSPYALTEGTPPGPFARVDGLKGAHSMFHGALGRMPIGDLGQPLPGTAPPPGTNIPLGPVDGLPDPAAPPPPILPPLPPLG